jgi:hypothetical protein
VLFFTQSFHADLREVNVPILMQMLRANVPLHTWRTFVPDDESRAGLFVGSFQTKKVDEQAASIVRALSHDAVVTLVAQEWEELPQLIRTRVTQTANARREDGSNNVSKGIDRLNKQLGGKLLVENKFVATERKLEVVGDQLVATQKAIKPNVAGAVRAFGIVPSRPDDYDSWPAARKREWNQTNAKIRREARS